MEVDGATVDDSGLGRLGRLALAYLVAERHRPVTRAELADVLWGDELPRSWETSLRGVALRLRGLFGAAGLPPAASLTSAFGCWQLQLPADAEVDLETAAARLAGAEAALVSGRPGDARPLAEDAAAVAGRGFLPESEGAWVERRQAELRELHLRALETLADAAEATGDWAGALRAAEEAVSVEPFRESAHLRLMRAHAGAGNRGEALRAYERCRRVLAEELGVGPSPATEAAYLGPAGRGADPGRASRPRATLTGRPRRAGVEHPLPAHPARGSRRGAGRSGEGRHRLPAAHPHRDRRRGQDPARPRRRRPSWRPGSPTAPSWSSWPRSPTPTWYPSRCSPRWACGRRPGRAPSDTLAAHLRSRHLLLVLDNCEHLVGPSAALAEGLLRSCPRLTRAGHQPGAARRAGEATWRVPSLTAAGAIALFAERARALRPDFAVGRRCGGRRWPSCASASTTSRWPSSWPRARSSVLSVSEIPAGLDDRFRLLSGGARTAVPRQQTLRAMVDWTYDALSPVERRVFDRLAVFGSSFGLEAAEQVAGGDDGPGGVARGDVLDVLTGLVDKSLVLAERPAPGARPGTACSRPCATTPGSGWPSRARPRRCARATCGGPWPWPRRPRPGWRGPSRPPSSTTWRPSTTTCGWRWRGAPPAATPGPPSAWPPPWGGSGRCAATSARAGPGWRRP